MSWVDDLIKGDENACMVLTERLVSEENRKREEIKTKINYETRGYHTGKEIKSKGLVDDVQIREISDGENKYIVKDSLYSYHYDGETFISQDGVEVENKDVSVREFSVTDGSNTATLFLKKEAGEFHEYGSSQDSGTFERCGVRFSGTGRTSDDYYTIPYDVDITDINALRYHLSNSKYTQYASRFLDKYVIVTPKEKEAYKKFVESQPEVDEKELKYAQNRCVDNKLAILRKKIARNAGEFLDTDFESMKIGKSIKKLEKTISDKLFGKIKE